MANKIDVNLIIGNALIIMGSEKITRDQIYCYKDLVDKLLPKRYYVYGEEDIFNSFCKRYHFMVEITDFGNALLIKADKQTLERYFKIGVSKEIIKICQEAVEELRKLEIEDSDVCAVPCSRLLVVAEEKTLEFRNLKSSRESNIKINEVLEKLHINNLNEEGPVLKKTMKFNNSKMN